jgi:hypothetical protein
MKTKIIFGAVIVFLTIALVAATYGWFKERNKPAVSKTEYITVEKIKPIEVIKKVEVPIEKIVTIEKIKLVEKVKMPDWFVQNVDEQAIASGIAPSHTEDTNVICTVNTKTGAGNLVMKQKPQKFMGFPNDKQLYAKAGYSTNKETQITIGADWKFLRIGKIKVGVFGEGRASFGSGETGSSYPVEAVAGIIVTY